VYYDNIDGLNEGLAARSSPMWHLVFGCVFFLLKMGQLPFLFCVRCRVVLGTILEFTGEFEVFWV
jgi:hypothetical protein